MTKLDIPPIFVSFIYLLPKLLSKPALAYCAIRLSNEFLPVTIPTWATIVTCLLIQPMLYFVARAYKKQSQKAFARSRGAVISRSVEGSPMHITRSLIKSFTEGPVPGKPTFPV